MIFYELSAAPWIWLGIMIICLVLEAISYSLTTIWFAIGAFLCVFLSFAPIPFVFQILIFAILSLILLFLTRPLAKKRLSVKKNPTNADSMIGKIVILQKGASQNESGEAKLNGIVWTAKTLGEKIESGESCIIEEIRGNSLIVKKITGESKSAETV